MRGQSSPNRKAAVRNRLHQPRDPAELAERCATGAEKTSEQLFALAEKLRQRYRQMRQTTREIHNSLEETRRRTLELREMLRTLRSEIAEAKMVSANHHHRVSAPTTDRS